MIRYDTSAEKRSTNRLQHEFILVLCRSASDLGFRGNTRTAAGVLNPQLAKRHNQTIAQIQTIFFFLSQFGEFVLLSGTVLQRNI